MATVSQDVLGALLGALLSRGLLERAVYDKAVNRVRATTDFPDFFQAGREGEDADGCS